MAKDPAFLFYSADFLVGTALMSETEVGQYVKIMCHIHQSGHLTMEDMKNICPNISAKVVSKFKKDKDGKFFNERLEEEIQKRKKYSESRRNNRLKKKTKTHDSTYDKTYVNHMSTHMENENEDVNEDIILNEYKEWTDLILDRSDHQFDALLFNERLGVIQESVYNHWILDHLGLLHRYPKMRPKSQQSFRQSALKHLRENYKKNLNGKYNGLSKKEQHTASLVNGIKERWGADVTK